MAAKSMGGSPSRVTATGKLVGFSHPSPGSSPMWAGSERPTFSRLLAMALRLPHRDCNASRDAGGKIQAVVEHLHCRNLDAAADVGIIQGLYRK